MRTLLAIIISVGLVLSVSTGSAMAVHAVSMQRGLEGSAPRHDASAHPMIHEHQGGMEGCHKTSPKAPAHGCQCCDTKAKCPPQSCLCFKCFSALADVRPLDHTGMTVSARYLIYRSDKPPDNVRRPPAPPPQS